MTHDVCNRSLAAAALLAAAVLAGPAAWAQSFCSSDGQRQPTALLERFISADCEACWARAGPKPAPGELALDWIVPASKGADAPLSAAAIRDAGWRLDALRRPAPSTLDVVRHRVEAPRPGLRVSHGLAFNGYIGTSIALTAPQQGRWSSWLLLVETIPAGAEGTPIERNLVRNALQSSWGGAGPLSKEELARLYESRPMAVADGARPSRLRVVGWMEDGRGRMRAIAQSQCAAGGPGG
jgi:hypothetical protein